jgi:hydrogenase maturation factor
LAATVKYSNMCLTIPKKVVSRERDFFVVENPSGDRQEVKSLLELEIGDYCLTQQNVAIEKIGENEAQKIIEILRNYGGK